MNDPKSFSRHHPSFKECYGRAFMSGLIVFGLAFSGSYLTQQFLLKTYSRTIRLLLPTTIAASLSYYEAKRRIQECYSSFQATMLPSPTTHKKKRPHH